MIGFLGLNFLVWLKDLTISDRIFELYVKNCIYSQLETAQNPNFQKFENFQNFEILIFLSFLIFVSGAPIWLFLTSNSDSACQNPPQGHLQMPGKGVTLKI